MPFTAGVPQDSRTLAVPLLIASVVGLLACPQLLADDFDSSIEAAHLVCARATGCAAAGASSGGGGSAGAGAVTAGAAGSEVGGAGDSSGVGGSGPSANGGGTGDSPDASSPEEPPAVLGADASAGPDCWVVVLNDSTHIADNNCLGVHGWNAVETDPSTDTTVAVSYEDGNVCFSGSILDDSGSWGAVYSLTLANGAFWNAEALGVGGFQLEATGASLPPRVEVIYTTGDGDFCRVITPAAAVAVPFDTTHRDCDTGAGLAVPDPSQVSYLRLHVPIASDEYALDFCLRIRAIP